MALLIAPVSGALVAGGVYYGFSKLIQTRTEQHRRDLAAISVRLLETPMLVQAPPPAATRIVYRPFTAQLKENWNRDVGRLFAGFGSLDQWAQKLGRKLLDSPPSDEQAKPSDSYKTP